MPNPKRQAKAERIAKANAVIKTIASHGRMFFRHGCDGLLPGELAQRAAEGKLPEQVARFTMDDRGAVWYIDDYREDRIYVAYKGYWRGFSHGGTMKAVVESLYEYIRTGTPMPAWHFGPWQLWLQGGDREQDRWGYGWEAMEAVRAGVLATGAVAKPADPVPAKEGEEAQVG